MRNAIRVVIVCLLGCFATTFPASARQLRVKHFDAQIEVHKNGTIDVTETIEVQFTGARHGIYRTIPVQYSDPAGFNYALFLDPVSITDDSGQKLKYERSSQGRITKFKIYVPDAEDTTRTVFFHYQILNALRFQEDHDELYWNVTGNDWDAPIDLATAHIALPIGAAGARSLTPERMEPTRTTRKSQSMVTRLMSRARGLCHFTKV